MSKRLMFSAILATALMATTTFYTHAQNQEQETASAFEAANSLPLEAARQLGGSQNMEPSLAAIALTFQRETFDVDLFLARRFNSNPA